MHRLALRTPDGHPLQGGHPVVSCLACGAGFADSDPHVRYYDEYYARLARYAAEMGDDGRNGLVEDSSATARFEDSAGIIASLLGRTTARILDIGCANGTLLSVLRRRGFENVRGVDPSPAAAANAAAHGVRVDVATLTALPGDLGRFDCVCLTGVLEHLWEPSKAIDTAASLLRPGGILYVEVPDASRYLDPYIAPFHDFGIEHVNHFSEGTLVALAGRSGLVPVWTGPHDTELVGGAPCAGLVAAFRPGQRGEKGRPGRDEGLVDTLRAFVARSVDDFAAIDGRLEEGLAGSPEFALWGLGELAMKLLATDALERRRLVAVVDSNPARRGFSVGGVPVTAPEAMTCAGTPIVVATLLQHESVLAQVRRLGLSNPVVALTPSPGSAIPIGMVA